MAIDLKALAAKAAPLGNVGVRDDRVLHVDGDYAAYYYSGTDSTSIWEGRQAMANALSSIKGITGCGSAVIHLTTPGSNKGGRYLAATVKPYQGQRNGDRKPKNWYGMRSWLESGATSLDCQVMQWDDREADDGVAWAAYDAFENGQTPYILSRDKDFRMIPGEHLVWTTHQIVSVPLGTYRVWGIGEKWYGHHWFWLQMLMGDTADNIPGLEKYWSDNVKLRPCGEKTAEKLLAYSLSNEDSFDIVYNHYLAYYGAEGADRFAEQASLLWMRGDAVASVDDFLKVIPDPPQALLLAVSSLKDRIATSNN